MLMSFKAQKLPPAFATESFIRSLFYEASRETSRDPNLNLIFKYIGIKLSRSLSRAVNVKTSPFLRWISLVGIFFFSWFVESILGMARAIKRSNEQ